MTAAAAMYLAARGAPPISTVLLTLLGGGLVAGAANVINCYYDRDIDGIMMRTRNRPLPSERISPFHALEFSIILGLAGLFILVYFINPVTAILALGALAYYILVYTVWLKRRTHWSSLIGSGAGAFPPLIGWLAINDRLEVTPFLLFLLIVFWTPPHFWSLSIYYRKDYKLAGVETIPLRNTNLLIFLSSLGLIIISFLLFSVTNPGKIYLISASFLGTVLLIMSVNLLLRETPGRARLLFRYSIIYLVVLFGAMLIDRLFT
jgi:protoheme IX farnesyltransferase